MDSLQGESEDNGLNKVETGWRHFTFEWHVKNLFQAWETEEKIYLECPKTVSLTSPEGIVFKFAFYCDICNFGIDVTMRQLEGPKSIAYVRHESHFVNKTEFVQLDGDNSRRCFNCEWTRDQFEEDELDQDQDIKFSIHCSVRVCPVQSLFSPFETRSNPDDDEPGNVVSEAIASLYDGSGSMPFADVELKCQGGSVKCHRMMLAAWSDVFRAMFSHGNMTEAQTGQVEIKDCSLKSVQLFVEFMYKGKDPLGRPHRDCESLTQPIDEWDPRHLLDLLVLVNKYQVRKSVGKYAKHLLCRFIYGGIACSVAFCALRQPKDGGTSWEHQFYSMISSSIEHGLDDVTESLLHCLYMEDDTDDPVFNAENPLKKLQGWPQFTKDNAELGRKVAAFFDEKEKRPVTKFWTDLNYELSSSENEEDPEEQ